MKIQEKKDFLDAQYELFLHEYTRINPEPNADTTSQRRALLVMLVAAVIVSARHNIPFFLGETPPDVVGQIITVVIAISVVAMVEIGLVKLGEFIIEYLDIEFVQQMRPWLLLVGLVLLLTVAIFSNVLDQLAVKNIAVNENLKTAITILAGLTAPIMALITGVIFASLEIKVAQDQLQWNKKFQQQWRTFKTQNDISITVQPPQPTKDTRADTSNQPSALLSSGRTSGQGYTKNMSAQDIVRTYLDANPQHIKKPVRTIAELIEQDTGQSVGKSTVGDVRKELLNGHK